MAFYTFGCLVNKAETQELQGLFENQDYEIVESNADIIIVNSCAVTNITEKAEQKLILRQKKNNPHALTVLVGCAVKYWNENDKHVDKHVIDGCDIVISGDKKQNVIDEIEKLRKKRSIKKPHKIADYTPDRAFVIVQNGCDNACAYCIVPLVRGRSVSTPFNEVMHKTSSLTAEGYKEIVFSGLDLGAYEYEGYTLIDILKEADDIEGIKNIRLSSLEPMSLSHSFIEVLPQINKLYPHLHIPLQSGSNRILSLMNRKGNFEDYYSLIRKIRDKIPYLAISTDIIVGFPGETEKDFYDSMSNIVKCQFSDIHIFKYSRRKGTIAASMDEQVSEHKKANRATLLKGIKMQSRYNYYSQV